MQSHEEPMQSEKAQALKTSEALELRILSYFALHKVHEDHIATIASAVMEPRSMRGD